MSTNALPPELQIEISRTAERVILSLSGELDLQAAPELSSAVDSALESAVPLCIDLAGLTFMDSSGLAALVRAQRMAQASHQRLWLIGLTAQVRRLLELTGMLDAFDIRDGTS